MLPAEGSFEDVEVIMADTIRLFAKETLQQLPPKSNANTKPPSDRLYGAKDLQTTLHASVLAK